MVLQGCKFFFAMTQIVALKRAPDPVTKRYWARVE
jgi:hypothetical protein